MKINGSLWAWFRGGSRGWLCLGLLLWLGGVAAGRAQVDAPVFISPGQPLVSGAEGGVWLECVNSLPAAVSRQFEPVLAGTLTSVAGRPGVTLELNTNRSPVSVTIAPGGFARVEYRWAVPAGLTGAVTLAISNYNAVVIPVTGAAMAADGRRATNVIVAVTTPVSAGYLGFLTNHLSTYEPIYFIAGTYPAAKFQFSIKYRVFNLTNEDNPLGHVYFAYTQTSFWDLISKDPSFYDTSYKPSAFLLYNDVVPGGWAHLDLQSGMEHESNGRGGTGERSLNTVYLQPTATVNLGDSLAWRVQPRAWDYLSVGEYDQDLDHYRGYVDVLTDLTWTDPDSAERIQLGAKVRMGDDWDHEGLWFDLRFNLAGVPWLRTFNPTFQVEYFTGYGQTLRQYNASSHGLRVGLCLWY